MSSHHIVREKQEPALLILGMDSFDPELLGQLLEWSPTVIATSWVAEQLHVMGIKVDRVLGVDVGGVLQSNVTYISIHQQPPLSAALEFLTSENYGAVNIITDDFDALDYIPYVLKINMVVLHKNKKTYAITSGFSKWLPSAEVLTLYSEPNDLVIKGLAQLSPRQFTTVTDGVIRLEFTNHFIFISETV